MTLEPQGSRGVLETPWVGYINVTWCEGIMYSVYINGRHIFDRVHLAFLVLKVLVDYREAWYVPLTPIEIK